MNLSAADAGAPLLIISQFTLYGDTAKGRRPSWIAAARPEQAEPLVDAVVVRLRELGATVATGRFRADMAVELVHDGPVTVIVEVCRVEWVQKIGRASGRERVWKDVLELGVGGD